MPVNPARKILGQRTDKASEAAINHDFALDQPQYKRFLIYLNDLSPLAIYNRKVKESPIYLDPAKYRNAFKMFYFGTDKALVFKSPYLRRSFNDKSDVYAALRDHLNESAVLVVAGIFLASLFGISLGVVAAVKKNSWIGRWLVSLSMAGTSLPVFFVAIFFAWFFGFVLHRTTGLNMMGGLYSIDPFEGEYINWRNLILPALVLSFRPMALILLQTRNSLLDVMSRPYILTAKAKGVRRSMIIFNHAWLNTTAPLVLFSQRWLGAVLAATLFVEFIFGWNGIGKLAVEAIENSDLPVMMGIVLFISMFYILLNVLAELLYSTLDPRTELN